MARGFSKSNEDMLTDIDIKIEKKQDEINALKSRRKEIVTQRKADLADKLINAAEAKGVSINDLISSLENR